MNLKRNLQIRWSTMKLWYFTWQFNRQCSQLERLAVAHGVDPSKEPILRAREGLRNTKDEK